MVPNYKCPDFHLWKILPQFWSNKHYSTTCRQPRTVFEHVWAFEFHFLTCVNSNWPISNLRPESERKYSNRIRIIAGSPLSRPPPSYSKANLGITHTESLFGGYGDLDVLSKFVKIWQLLAVLKRKDTLKMALDFLSVLPSLKSTYLKNFGHDNSARLTWSGFYRCSYQRAHVIATRGTEYALYKTKFGPYRSRWRK